MRKPSTRGRHWPLAVFAAAWTGIIVYTAAPALHAFAREIQTLTFTPAEARAVSYTSRIIAGEKYLGDVLEYRYRVGGEERTGRRMFPTPGQLPRGVTPDTIRSEYPEGARFTAYVNPFDPDDAVVRPGIRGQTLQALLLLTPFLLTAWGLGASAWHRLRGPPRGKLASDVWATRAADGSWTLRVMVLSPIGLGLFVLGFSSLLAGMLLDVGTSNPYLEHAVAAWIAVGALAAAAFAWLHHRMRGGRYDWRYEAARGLLHPPGGATAWRRSEVASLVLVKSTRKDDDDNAWDVVAVELRSRNGEIRVVARNESNEGFDAAMEDLAGVLRFLEERLGLSARVESPT